jgi:hypothetical protein
MNGFFSGVGHGQLGLAQISQSRDYSASGQTPGFRGGGKRRWAMIHRSLRYFQDALLRDRFALDVPYCMICPDFSNHAGLGREYWLQQVL